MPYINLERNDIPMNLNVSSISMTRRKDHISISRSDTVNSWNFYQYEDENLIQKPYQDGNREVKRWRRTEKWKETKIYLIVYNYSMSRSCTEGRCLSCLHLTH